MVLPPTILTEVIAQVGAILILAKPENQQKLPFFAGIERVRYRKPVHPWRSRCRARGAARRYLHERDVKLIVTTVGLYRHPGPDQLHS